LARNWGSCGSTVSASEMNSRRRYSATSEHQVSARDSCMRKDSVGSLDTV